MWGKQLAEAKDQAGMVALKPHFQWVLDRALPQADDKAAMLAAVFLLITLELGDIATIRDYLSPIKQLEVACGFSILPEGIEETIAHWQSKQIVMEEGEFFILQILACLADEPPVPQVILLGAMSPPAEVAKMLDSLAEKGYVVLKNAGIQVTNAGIRWRQPVSEEIQDAVVSGLDQAVAQALAKNDHDGLENICPHLQTMAEAAMVSDPERAHHLLLTLIKCLIGLDEFMVAAEYIDRADVLEIELGVSAAADTPKDREKALQYHTQVAVHYLKKPDHARALPHLQQAIGLTEAAPILAQLYQKLGGTYGVLGDNAGKTQAHMAALEHALAHFGEESWEVLPHRSDLALHYLEVEEVGLAEHHLLAAEKVVAPQAVADSRYYREVAKVHLLLGMVAYSRGQRKAGANYVTQALTFASHLNDYPEDKVHLLYMAGDLYLQFGYIAEATPLVVEAYTLCQAGLEMNEVEAAHIREAVEELYRQIM